VPLLTVVAGPNGSGKSTLTSSVCLAGVDTLINADAIARPLNPEHPARAAIAAREAILLCRAALSVKHTFVLETTVAGHGAMTVCDNARDNCPVFPSNATRIHWGFEDPAAVEGTEEVRLAAFRRIRDQIRDRVEEFFAKQD
jgi:hypothetical protein